jgi:hypothetical protein
MLCLEVCLEVSRLDAGASPYFRTLAGEDGCEFPLR